MYRNLKLYIVIEIPKTIAYQYLKIIPKLQYWFDTRQITTVSPNVGIMEGEFIITPKKMETWFHLPTPHGVVRWETTTDRDQRFHPDSSHSLILVVDFNLS